MKYYKNAQNDVLAFEADGSQDKLIGKDLIPITSDEATAISNPPMTADQISAELSNQAKLALDASDIVAIRCIKAGVAFPSEWQTYCDDLRAIVNGSSQTMPTKPKYPAGT